MDIFFINRWKFKNFGGTSPAFMEQVFLMVILYNLAVDIDNVVKTILTLIVVMVTVTNGEL